MAIAHNPRYVAAALGAGLALSLWATAAAQPPSSGSGTGTGTGGSGLGSTGTGSAATPGGAMQPTRPGDIPEPLPLPGSGGPLETLPNLGRPIYGLQLNEEQLKELDARLLDEARAITQPEDRALAMVRIARSKVFGRDYDAAQTALVEAGQAALECPPGLVRDLRIMAVVRGNPERAVPSGGFLNLAEAQSSEGSAENLLTGIDEPLSPDILKVWSRTLNSALKAWGQAAELAQRIAHRPYRSQTMFEVVESFATDLSRRGAFLDQFEGRIAEELKAFDPAEVRAGLKLVDAALAQGVEHSGRIDLPLWRDRALATLVSGAAGARRFDQGLKIALAIPRPDARADALLRLAEAQARHGSPEGATQSYTEALRAVASIPVTDLRIILASVLIDSLIASGRFEDARAAIVLYPDPWRQRDALGAVAYSQGFRGLSESAKAWIAEQPSPQVKSHLYRRLNDGVLASLEQFRTNVYSVNPTP